jgi:hypothetical protein
MFLIICPGIHDPSLTENFIQGLELSNYCDQILILPTEIYRPYSPSDVSEFLRKDKEIGFKGHSLVFISFSAGVVGAIGVAQNWQKQANIKAFFAFDGWGVPLQGEFPIYRISHDYFTHWSSAILGSGQENFYADPPVAHLDLWRSPQTINGTWEKGLGCSYQSNLKDFITNLLQKCKEI